MRWLLAILFLFGTTSAAADSGFYGELHAGVKGVRHSELDFYPTFGSLSAGVFIVQNVGIEVFADVALSASEKGNFEIEIAHASGVAIRFQSPPQQGLRAYLTLGYVDFAVEQSEADTRGARQVTQGFSGGRVSVGITRQLASLPQLRVILEYRNYYVDQGITVDGLSFGLRVALP